MPHNFHPMIMQCSMFLRSLALCLTFQWQPFLARTFSDFNISLSLFRRFSGTRFWVMAQVTSNPYKAHHTLADFLSGDLRFFITNKNSASVVWILTSHDKVRSCRWKFKHVWFSDVLTDLVGWCVVVSDNLSATYML